MPQSRELEGRCGTDTAAEQKAERVGFYSPARLGEAERNGAQSLEIHPARATLDAPRKLGRGPNLRRNVTAYRRAAPVCPATGSQRNYSTFGRLRRACKYATYETDFSAYTYV